MRSISGSLTKRDDRRDVHAHPHPRLREPADRRKAPLRGGGARLQNPPQRRIQRRDADEDQQLAALRHLGQQVQVAQDAARLGHDRQRLPRLVQHLQHATGEAQLALDRLVGVGGRAEVDRLRAPAGSAQRDAQALGGIDLGDQTRFEIQPGRQVQVTVSRPCITVDAAMLAAAVGIDRPLEGQVGRVVAREDLCAGLQAHLGGNRRRTVPQRAARIAPAVIDRLAGVAFEAVRDLPAGATPARWARRLRPAGACGQGRRHGETGPWRWAGVRRALTAPGYCIFIQPPRLDRGVSPTRQRFCVS